MTLNKKIVILCCIAILSLSGCTKYDDIAATLDEITIQNTLPKVAENASYNYLDEIDELVYQQQINACKMFSDTYKKTHYQQFEDGKRKSGKIAILCNEKRKDINTEIEVAYAINIYRMLQDVVDCTNPDAYVVKTHKDIVDFYDIYDEYLNGDNPQQVLVDILVEYYSRSNILALKFLGENANQVYKAALLKIEENANTDEGYKACISENNKIVKALNEVYGTIPSNYADKISEFNTLLAKKLLTSYETITDDKKEKLMKQLESDSTSPTPTAKASASPMPSITPTPTTAPVPTRIPATEKPATPAPTKAPTPSPTPTSKPTATPTQRPVATNEPVSAATATPKPYEPSFSYEDDTEETVDESDGSYTFE